MPVAVELKGLLPGRGPGRGTLRPPPGAPGRGAPPGRGDAGRAGASWPVPLACAAAGCTEPGWAAAGSADGAAGALSRGAAAGCAGAAGGRAACWGDGKGVGTAADGWSDAAAAGRESPAVPASAWGPACAAGAAWVLPFTLPLPSDCAAATAGGTDGAGPADAADCAGAAC
jgi:hypothetical protein